MGKLLLGLASGILKSLALAALEQPTRTSSATEDQHPASCVIGNGGVACDALLGVIGQTSVHLIGQGTC